MEMTIINIFFLLVLFQLKHFAADYPLQTEYMLGKFKDRDWVLPLTCHALVHFIFTALIIGAFTTDFWLVIKLAAFDFIMHFTMDRIKASRSLLGRWNTSDSAFWNVVGLDQMVHHFTHYIIIYIIITQG